MGKWVTHCSECAPSENMKKRFHTTVAAAPEKWIFQIITEDGHNRGVRTPKKAGTWYLCVYNESSEGNTILKFTLSYNDSGKYMIRVKADTNSCPFDDDNHLRSSTELSRWEQKFLANPPFDISSWRTVPSTAKQSITIVKYECENLDEMCEVLLESLDDIDEKLWI